MIGAIKDLMIGTVMIDNQGTKIDSRTSVNGFIDHEELKLHGNVSLNKTDW